MNEQLVVKNFGPIKDATVDFKRVTVFIGPTGGGKSTLAKLATILKNKHFLSGESAFRLSFFKNHTIDRYFQNKTFIGIINEGASIALDNKLNFSTPTIVTNDLNQSFDKQFQGLELDSEDFKLIIESLSSVVNNNSDSYKPLVLLDALSKLSRNNKKAHSKLEKILVGLGKENVYSEPKYLPAERIFISAIEYSWAGLMRDDISLPKSVLEFANIFSIARRVIKELEIPFLDAKYVHLDGLDYIKIPALDELIRIREVASGIQAVTPMLVLLEHLSRNTEQAQSFIIEEPELNLYPTAQQGLLNWLVEKCTKGENDLTLTTHSPYILSHLNLLLYAHHVGTKDEEKRQKVAAIIPEQYWLNPDEFAAYYVNGPEGAGGVRSLLDPETKLISQNELDAVSGVQADEFDQLLDINRGF